MSGCSVILTPKTIGIVSFLFLDKSNLGSISVLDFLIVDFFILENRCK